jgi:AraC-like DNA-binding protein
VSRDAERNNRLLLRARDLIDARYTEPLDVPTLAAAAYCSPAHFSRTFKATFGETPHRYLQRRRSSGRPSWLRETAVPVTDVALAVGFGSLGTFSRTFRDIVGRSPSEYRRTAVPVRLPGCRVRDLMRPSSFGEAGATRSG